jgi:PqqD family protein of HPr-rel-A system
VRRGERVISTEVGDELVVLNAVNGRCMHLNATGAHMWELLSEPARAQELADALVARWSVAPERARADVERFLDSLASRGIVEISSVAAS